MRQSSRSIRKVSMKPLFILAGLGLGLVACGPSGDEQATAAPLLAAIEEPSTTQVTDDALPASDAADGPGSATDNPATTEPGGTAPTTAGGQTTEPGGSSGESDEPTDTTQTTEPGGTDDEAGGDEGAGGRPGYELLVHPINAIVSQGCRDQADFPRIFQAGNAAIVVDTFGVDTLRSSTFSDDIWVELHGGPRQPQIELGTGQTALTTLQRATAATATGHQVAVSVFGFVSGGIEIRWATETTGTGALTSPRFHPLNDTTSPCWVQLNTAVIEVPEG